MWLWRVEVPLLQHETSHGTWIQGMEEPMLQHGDIIHNSLADTWEMVRNEHSIESFIELKCERLSAWLQR